MAEAQAARIACTAYNDPVEVLRDGHLTARGYWTQVGHSEAGTLPYTGPSFRKEGEGWRLRSTAPLLGQHNREVLCGILGLSAAEVATLRDTGAI